MSEMWENVAGGWEELAEVVDQHVAAATAAMLDGAQVGPGDAVIDLACGPGGAGIAAASRVGEGGRVVLADVAPSMVAAAGRRAAHLPQVTTLVCDELSIDAADGTFDAALCRFGLMFAVPPEDAVREAARVLRPGGRYGVMTWDAREDNNWLGLVFDAVAEQFDAPFPPPTMPGPFALSSTDAVVTALTGGGLSGVEVTRVTAPFTVATLDQWWDRVVKLAGPLAQAMAAMEPDVREAIHERALAKGEAAARETADGLEFTGSVLVGSGQRS